MLKSKLKVFVLVLIVILALVVLLFSYIFYDKEDIKHPQQCTGTIVYIAKDFYSDNYILYVDVDTSYSAKEKLRLFIVSSETIKLSDAVDMEWDDILVSRRAGSQVEITYQGTQIEVEEKLWAYPAEIIVCVSRDDNNNAERK